ncbi:hypothetical protein TSTA_016010 [Talaromyces stipitatus ATCC 10500]|uniref:Uncharacterized protein n=1 Tax=Talaromyces stipitatus (strain ATCC 10500 / CBS 375.48 / QM 6759 / NRRL 1006) TaxID=441959 RepID=B8ME94_TALSN|nr:uncharacterized protein TSTA_016010 [Talaromyces stipitatus ATCC 10500]EED16521.1 hypothetical protein TSTA_016010 [Talaromyces stipitatus ATCC 10500]
MEVEGLDLVESCVFSLDDCQYAAYPSANDFIPELSGKSGLVMVVLLETYVSCPRDFVQAYVQFALDRDDVFNSHFLKGIIFYGRTAEKASLVGEELGAHILPAAWNTSWTSFIQTPIASDYRRNIPPGPYLLRQGKLWDVYRLYEDHTNAFLVSFKPQILPTRNERLVQLSVQCSRHYSRSIAVPSRLVTTSDTLKSAPIAATISGRMPAQVNGCFSMRPTCGMISTEGMWSGAPQFDTPCIFSRAVADLGRIVSAWYGDKLKETRGTQNYSLIYLTDSTPQNRAQMDVFDRFAQDMESFLRTTVQRLSIKDLWNQKPPIEAAGNTLEEWLHKDVATQSYIFYFWKKIEGFYNDYKIRFGKEPFMPPPHGIDLWEPAKDVTPEQHTDAMNRLQVYRNWLREKIFLPENERVIAIMPLRETADTKFTADVKAGQHLWDPLLLSPILSSPEIVVPIGQLPYLSRISGNIEYLPVSGSIMGTPGSDLDLVHLVNNFWEQVGRPTKILTGKTMFNVV